MKNILKGQLTITIIAAFTLFTLSGCLSMQNKTATTSVQKSSKSEPYFPTSFGDLEVPGELKLDRKNTLFINTSSFNGGIINLSGRVETGSLTDFFVHSMQKNGWKINGEVRYENVLLAFNKPNKNCMITIYGGDFGTSTQVFVYITESTQQ